MHETTTGRDNGQPYHTYKELLRTACHTCSGNVLFEWVEDGAVQRKTYGEFFEEVTALGTALWEKGLENTHIGILGKNSYAWVLCFAAVLLGKTVAVPLSVMAPAEIVLEQIRHSDVALLVHSDALAPFVEKTPDIPAIPMSALPELVEEGRRLLAAGRRGFIDFFPSPEQLAFIMYTSGTTGTAKGVMISHRAYVSQAAVISSLFLSGEKCLATYPFYHIGDLVQGLAGNFASGKTFVLNTEIRNIFSDMRRTAPNSADIVPMVVEGIYKRTHDMSIEEAKGFLGGNLQTIVTGGASLEPFYREHLKTLGISVISVYGMTEFCVFVTYLLDEFQRPDSVGKALPGVSIRIDNPDKDGNGEVVVHKDHILDGYYKNPEETARVLKNGWFHTGDLGRLDADGFLYITGRLKNLIILSNGENVAPEELEVPLSRNPYILECIVYESQGAIAASVYPDPAMAAARGLSGKALEDTIRSEVDALNKTLTLSRHIRKVIVSETPLPRTTSGKLKRNMS